MNPFLLRTALRQTTSFAINEECQEHLSSNPPSILRKKFINVNIADRDTVRFFTPGLILAIATDLDENFNKFASTHMDNSALINQYREILSNCYIDAAHRAKTNTMKIHCFERLAESYLLYKPSEGSFQGWIFEHICAYDIIRGINLDTAHKLITKILNSPHEHLWTHRRAEILASIELDA